jgi:DNA-binding HxlR family transcriptional regulator
MRKARRSKCPISYGLDIFGDKWSLLILRDIMFYGKTRYSDFVNSAERIATNILANRLELLEDSGIINKRQDMALPNQFIYSVTEKGKDLMPILIELTLWGVRYDPKTPASNEFIRRAKKDRRRLAEEVAKSIEEGTFLKLVGDPARRNRMRIRDE